MARHGSMQLPAMQACPLGQTAPLQGSLQVPLMHFVPSGHVTPIHFGSTHRPFASSHSCCGGHGNSPPHLGTQLPLSHTWPAGQISPSSTCPLQSLSNPSHFSFDGPIRGMHVSCPVWHCCV